MSLSVGKSVFFAVPKLDFFGHTFSAKGVRANEDKLKAILEAGPPQTVTELRSLLGMCQYVARFISNYITTIAPLQKLTHQDECWRWGEEQQSAFTQLKQKMAEAGTLRLL